MVLHLEEKYHATSLTNATRRVISTISLFYPYGWILGLLQTRLFVLESHSLMQTDRIVGMSGHPSNH